MQIVVKGGFADRLIMPSYFLRQAPKAVLCLWVFYLERGLWMFFFLFFFIHFNAANMSTPAKPQGTRMQIALCLCFFIKAIRANLIRTSRFQAVVPLLLVCLVGFHFLYFLQAEPCKIKPINCLQNLGLNWLHMTKPKQIPLIPFQLPHW